MSNPMDRDQLRVNVLRNALYHTARRKWLERINRVFNLVIILLGMAAVLDVLSGWGLSVKWIGAFVAFVGALQLVFDFGRTARDHQHLQREYYHLLATIEEVVEPASDQLSMWYARMIRITADEPPTLRVVDAKAYNDAVDALDMWTADERLEIPWYITLLGHLNTFEGYRFQKFSELTNAASSSKITT